MILNLTKLDNGLAESPTVIVGEAKQNQKQLGKNRGILKPSWAFVVTNISLCRWWGDEYAILYYTYNHAVKKVSVRYDITDLIIQFIWGGVWYIITQIISCS
jgi:hypothetical protein